MNREFTKERLIQFIHYIGIPVSTFEKSVGLSNGYIANFKGNMGSEKLEVVLKTYPQLNKDWLLTGNGDMIRAGYENVKKNRTIANEADDRTEFLWNVYKEAVYVGKVKNKMEFASLIGISSSALSRALHGNISYLTDILIAKLHNLHSAIEKEVKRRKSVQSMRELLPDSNNETGNNDTNNTSDISVNSYTYKDNYRNEILQKQTKQKNGKVLYEIDRENIATLLKQIEELKSDKDHLQRMIEMLQNTIAFLQKQLEKKIES